MTIFRYFYRLLVAFEFTSPPIIISLLLLKHDRSLRDPDYIRSLFGLLVSYPLIDLLILKLIYFTEWLYQCLKYRSLHPLRQSSNLVLLGTSLNKIMLPFNAAYSKHITLLLLALQ